MACAQVRLACGEVVRVVGSPWTSYDTKGKEHLSVSHHWRPEGGGLFGGATLGLREERLDCGAWWERHWARVGGLLDAYPALYASPKRVLVLDVRCHGHELLANGVGNLSGDYLHWFLWGLATNRAVFIRLTDCETQADKIR